MADIRAPGPFFFIKSSYPNWGDKMWTVRRPIGKQGLPPRPWNDNRANTVGHWVHLKSVSAALRQELFLSLGKWAAGITIITPHSYFPKRHSPLTSVTLRFTYKSWLKRLLTGKQRNCMNWESPGGCLRQSGKGRYESWSISTWQRLWMTWRYPWATDFMSLRESGRDSFRFP